MHMGTNENYTHFKNSLRPEVKLQISLKEYLSMSPEEKESNAAQAYRKYLSERRRPAWEMLIREENLDGFRMFVREGWLTAEDTRECLKMAARLGKKESQLWLLSYIKKGGDEWRKKQNREEENRITQEDTDEIFEILDITLQADIPALASAFPAVARTEVEQAVDGERVWGTDGICLYYTKAELVGFFIRGIEYLARVFLHTVFHCLYLHVIPPEEKDYWDLACDLAAEWALDESGWFPLENMRKKQRNSWYQMIWQEEKKRDTGACLRWLEKLAKEGKTEDLLKIQQEFTVDCHAYWYEQKNKPGRIAADNRENMVETWENLRQNISMQMQGRGLHAGRQGGAGTDVYQPVHKRTYDYRKFLKQFAVCREEMQLDMESFDYIPYVYGLERYGNVLLVEPMETTEVRRLEEFVIAIDTSGSCSGEIVCRFLDETYQILSSQENFFRKMKVHIIQCDSMIQDHQVITCEEDWKSYQQNVKIQGLGGTDFTPVFRLVDEMLANKQIRHLKGLLYFTDGDGIFPHKKTEYETAFVFLNRALEKSRIPDWAIRLNLA